MEICLRVLSVSSLNKRLPLLVCARARVTTFLLPIACRGKSGLLLLFLSAADAVQKREKVSTHPRWFYFFVFGGGVFVACREKSFAFDAVFF